MVSLSLPAVKQLLLGKGYSKQEEADLLTNIYNRAIKFDHSGKGELTEKELYNVLKMQNQVDCTRDEVTKICAELPRTKSGKIKVEQFMKLPILSEEAFKAIDKNRDGFITKGELKLANKKSSMKEITQKIDDHDLNFDKRLNLTEFKRSGKSS